jgi:hypothetical protein
MVAFQKNLVAAADAHQLMAELGETGSRVAGAGEDDDGQAEDECLKGLLCVALACVARVMPAKSRQRTQK